MSEQAQTPPIAAPSTPASAGGASPAGVAPPPVEGAVEAKVEPAKVEPKIEVDAGVSKHFAELEKRKRDFEAERKAHADKLKSEEADRKQFDEWRTQRDAAKKDPVKAFGLLGMTPDDVAKALYEAPQEPDEMTKYKGRLEQLEAKLAAEEKAKADAERARVEAENMKVVNTAITKHLEAPDFEYSRALGERSLGAIVNELTLRHTKSPNDTPDLGDTCSFIEKDIDGLIELVSKTEKFKRKYLAKAEAPKTAEVQAPEEKKPATADQKPAPKVVLSNKTSADTPASGQPPDAKSLRERAVRVIREREAARAAALKKGAEK